MKEFVVVAILDKASVGDKFQMWPLHLTILPWFESGSVEEAVELLKPTTKEHEPVKVTLGDFAKYGANRTVRLIKPSPSLNELHKQLLRAVQASGWSIRGRYTGEHFSPHVTRTGGRDFKDDNFVIDKLYIAEALSQGYRKIVAEMNLKHV